MKQDMILDRLEAILSRGEIFIGGEPASMISARARRQGWIWRRGDPYREGCRHHECLQTARRLGLIRPLTVIELKERALAPEKTTT